MTVAKPKPRDTELGRKQLQEVYSHLDHYGERGNAQIAWYGQLRAKEYSHAEALEKTIEQYRLRREVWYQARFKEKTD